MAEPTNRPSTEPLETATTPATAAPASPLLSARQLRSSRAGPFDLALGVGECVCVVGRSGAGKSVFLRLLADLDPAEGVVRLAGRDRSEFSGPQWRTRVVYQAAEPAWWMPLVREHFAPSLADAAVALMARLDLAAELFDRPVAQLSTGQRQRLALVRSAAGKPDVLLLDEPTASLDDESTARVEALARDLLRQGAAIVWVTHSREQAGRIGHRVLTLDAGKLVSP